MKPKPTYPAAIVNAFRTGWARRQLDGAHVLILEVDVDGSLRRLALAFPVEAADQLILELSEALATFQQQKDPSS